MKAMAAELKRRKVYRTAYLYVVFGLGLLGAAELILDPLGLGQMRRVVVLATLAGFPVALILAWLFDLRTERPSGPARAAVAIPTAPATAPIAGPARGGRRLAAIMFADMVGYTAMLQEDEAKARRSRNRLRQTLTANVEARGGAVAQFYGDGALSVFQSAVGAVEGAVAIQRELAGEPRVPVRIGIHIGDVVHDEEGAFGDGVNVASRIEALSVPGGILVSGKVYDEVKNQGHIDTKSLGVVRLKNVTDPVPVYAVCGEGLVVPASSDFRGTDAQGSSIAVLPFMNMSTDEENEYFSDGITEELINLLTRVNGLQVTARTSSFSFKGKHIDVREIGRQLGVAHVLEGSVRRSGNRVRITAQLISAADGYHLFSETFDRTVEDVFATQDEISETIVGALTERLAHVHTSSREGGSPRISPQAHREYLKGLFHWARWTPEGSRKAMSAFERAIELDPTAALPHSGLSHCYAYLAFIGQVSFDVSYPAARTHAERALELDPTLGEAHVSLALVDLFGDWDFDGAYAHFQKALTLNPGSAGVRHMYAIYLMSTGRSRDALAEMRLAVALDPFSPMMKLYLAFALQACGQVEEATGICNAIVEADPQFRPALESLGWIRLAQGQLEEATEAFEALHRMLGDPLKGVADLGYVYAIQGRTEEAREMLSRLEQRRERDPDVVLGIDFALVLVGLGDIEKAAVHLRDARDRHMAGVLMLPNHPPWSSLMHHPAVAAVYTEIGRPLQSAPTQVR